MTATLTLTDFLLARIAEDEAAEVGAQSWSDLSDLTARVLRTNGVYLASHNSARVLRDCQAKRRIVELAHFADEDGAWPVYLRAVQYLASAYSDHPDYREEWTP